MLEFLFSVGAIALTGLALGLGTLLGRGPLRRGCCRHAGPGSCDDAASCGTSACDAPRPPGAASASIYMENER